MFKSITYKKFGRSEKELCFDLEDSEFGIVECSVGRGSWIGLFIIEEYIKRDLDAGKAIAIFTIQLKDRYRETIETYTLWQNTHMSKHLPNWKDIALARDEYLAKILLLE